MNAIHKRQNPLDSRQLNAFASLVRTGNVTQTAQELSLTHSAISHSLRTLESELGCRLLNRVGKKIDLTAAGEAFLFYAQSGLKNFELARQTVQDFKQWGKQRLKIGVGTALLHRFLPKVLARLQAQHPNLLLTVKVVRPPEIATVLQTGEFDILLETPLNHAPGIEFTPLFDAPVKIVVSSTHRWAAQGCMPAKELAKEPCVLPDKSHPTRQLIDRYFATQNTVINGVADIESLEVIKEMLMYGLAMSILPECVVRDELKSGILAGFFPGRKHLQQSWGFLRLRGRPVTPIESTFQVLCIQAAKSLQLTN